MSKRRRILEAAAMLFSQKGFNKTSAAEIAEAADTAQGTIFYHFGTKHGVLFEVYTSLINQYLEGLKEVSESGSNGLEAVKLILKYHYDFSREHWDEYTTIHRDLPFIRGHETYDFKLIQQNTETSTMYVKHAIDRGIADGSIRPDTDSDGYARLIKTTLIGLARITITQSIELSSSLEVMTDFCIKALENNGGAA